MAEPGSWWWCRRHERVEGPGTTCRPEDRLGPYESESAARHWRERLEARDEQWKAEDRAWSGEDED